MIMWLLYIWTHMLLTYKKSFIDVIGITGDMALDTNLSSYTLGSWGWSPHTFPTSRALHP